MKMLKDKVAATMIVLFFVLSMTGSMTLIQTTNAHSPPWTNIPTHCYIAPAPPTVGIGQAESIVFWLDWVPPTAAGATGDRWTFYVDVIKPDGTNDTYGPIKSDPVGGNYIMYTPDIVGTYTAVCRFPGQTLTGILPSGALSTNAYVNDTFAADTSDPAYFTVQEEPIPRYQETPLPTDYWTRPINDVNRGWGSAVMGQWLGGPAFEDISLGLRFTGIPYTTGPESSHILWTRQVWSGGVMGGQSGDVGYYNGVAYEGFSGPQIVLDGKAYYSVQQPPIYGWYCIDLYTGETIYYENNTDGHSAMPAFGQVLNYNSPNQFGGFDYLWRTSGVVLPTGYTSGSGTQTWEMLDGFTGHSICKIANVSATGTQFIDNIGSRCYINFVNKGTAAAPKYYLQIWNTTEAIMWQPSFGVYPPKTLADGTTNIPLTSTSNDYWMWRPLRLAVYDGNNGFSMNVSVASILGPQNSLVNQTGTIQQIVPDKFVIVGTNGRNDDRGTVQGYLRAYSLAAPTWGQTLWTTSFTPPKAVDDYPNSTYQGEASVPQIVAVSSQDGVFIMGSQRYGYTPEVWAYSLDTGEQLWEAKTTSTQWYYYGESSNSLSKVIYQGKLLTIYRGGELSAFNVTTGQFLWNWTAPSVGYLETPYTYTPLQLTFFADGKAYFQSYEGAGLNSPIRRDGALWCVDTNTGQMLWRLTCWPAYSNNRMANPVIADGRILALDARDCQIYCFGKGSSATTVTASPKVSVNGDDVLIEGTVTDNSPSGRHNTNGGLDFALKGTPAISDASMEAWMDYMFHQRPKPMNATGVQLSLDTIDPNGNYIHIGNTTSDINGNYAIPYRPQVPGTYQIIATFQGTNSYGSSSATTYLTVSEAPTSTPAATAQPQSIADMYFVPAIVGLFIFVAIIAAAIMLMFRKRP